MDVKTLCLGVILREPVSGYGIRKLFESGPLSHFAEASFGSIYPALKQLLDDGLIEETEAQDSGRPGQKPYRITPRGEAALIDALLEPPGRDRVRSDFSFTLCFAHRLPQRFLRRIVDERINMLRDFLAKIEGCVCDEPHRRRGSEDLVMGMGDAIYRAELAYLEAKRGAIIARGLVEAPLNEAAE